MCTGRRILFWPGVLRRPPFRFWREMDGPLFLIEPDLDGLEGLVAGTLEELEIYLAKQAAFDEFLRSRGEV